MYSAAKHRNVVVSKVRKQAAKSRFVKIRKLASISRASRKVASGAYAQQLWGHRNVGVSVGDLQATRTRCANTTGIKQGGRCTYTAVAICFGKRGDPQHRIIKELVSSYVDVIAKFDTSLLQSQLAHAWSKITDSMFGLSPNRTIMQVQSVVSNMVHMLLS